VPILGIVASLLEAIRLFSIGELSSTLAFWEQLSDSGMLIKQEVLRSTYLIMNLCQKAYIINFSSFQTLCFQGLQNLGLLSKMLKLNLIIVALFTLKFRERYY
jgi:hypothetical protein